MRWLRKLKTITLTSIYLETSAGQAQNPWVSSNSVSAIVCFTPLCVETRMWFIKMGIGWHNFSINILYPVNKEKALMLLDDSVRRAAAAHLLQVQHAVSGGRSAHCFRDIRSNILPIRK